MSLDQDSTTPTPTTPTPTPGSATTPTPTPGAAAPTPTPTPTPAAGSKWDAEHISRLVITLLVLAGVFWWLKVSGDRLRVPPVRSEDGTVIFDEFQRAKDILMAVLPFLTLALGYWFGVRGADKAEENADKAEVKADEAKQEANTAKKQVVAIVSASDDTGLLARAKQNDPTAFGLGVN